MGILRECIALGFHNTISGTTPLSSIVFNVPTELPSRNPLMHCNSVCQRTMSCAILWATEQT